MAIKVKKNKVYFKGKPVDIVIDMPKGSWWITALVKMYCDSFIPYPKREWKQGQNR